MLVMITCSSILALAITVFELHTSYKHGVADIEKQHNDVQLMFAGVLTEQIWELDDRAAQASIAGLARLDTIDRVELSWEDYSELAAGEKITKAEIESVIPLYKMSHGEDHLLGELHLYSNLLGVRQEIFSLLGVKLLFNFLKTLVVTGVVLYFFHRLANVHLHKISDHAKSLVLGREYKPLKLNRDPEYADDELQTLVDAINGMGCRLQNAFLDSETQQQELESLIQERTEHLELANQQIIEKSRLATIGSLVAMVAHELRNPLGTIKASVDLLNARCKDERDLDVLQRIDRNVERCDKTVEQLRRLGKKSVRHWVVVDLAQWLEDYLETKFVVSPVINFKTNLRSGVWVFIDDFQLDLVVRNILENALQALDHDALGLDRYLSIELKVDQTMAFLQFEDNGIGLNSNVLQHAFDPLYSTKQYGFGMGLAISRNLIESLGGKIDLRSDGPMQGAIVEIRLPLTTQHIPPQQVPVGIV